MLLQAYLASPRARRALSTRPGDAGFSLIELVVVIAILGILIAIALPNFLNVQKDAKINQAKNSLVGVIKECSVSEARDTGVTFDDIKADNGKLGEYVFVVPTVGSGGISAVADLVAGTNSNERCFTIGAVPGGSAAFNTATKLPSFAIAFSNGDTAKYCEYGGDTGAYPAVDGETPTDSKILNVCDPSKNSDGTAW